MVKAIANSSGLPIDVVDGDRSLVDTLPALDEVLDAYAPALGHDFTSYRNHAYRIVNLCVRFVPADPLSLEKLAIAAAFHDLGIWTDHTFDYLQPSSGLATAYLARTGRDEWTPEIVAMILEHHKISPYRERVFPLVEPFRRADWIDVTRGVRRFGLPRRVVRDLYDAWPSAGFHRRLIQLSLQRLRTHPRTPLPMLRL